LTGAASALTTFQNDLQSNSGNNPLSQLFSNNSTLNGDLTALQTALQANNPSSAQAAFTTLEQDMLTAMKSQKGHRHHPYGGGNASQAASATTSTPNANAASNAVGSTSNASPSGAANGFNQLFQDFQG